MNRYSSSYVYSKSNFVLMGIDVSQTVSGIWGELASVVLNIIQRGTPTPVPARLYELLGAVPCELEGHPRPVRQVLTHSLKWRKTIKGSPDGRLNPALQFFKEMLPNALPPSLHFITGYILPEALITDIVENCDPRFIEQRVDFYCPRARLAIEIDGSQHGQKAQSYLDIERDMYLEQNGIETVRIATSHLDASDAARKLVQRFDFGDEPDVVLDEAEQLAVFGYEMAIRAQVAIVECIRVGVLDLTKREWTVCLIHDQSGIDCESVFVEATQDVFDLFENLCVLLGIEFVRPYIKFAEQAEDLVLNLSVTKCWSELESASGVIYARNDYYEDKDNYRVACAQPIVYDTLYSDGGGGVEKSLKYFLKYLFGYDEFNSGQMNIIRRALARKPTLGILPTGSGKSLCYQMACLLQPCISFVVCPIISLIQDQDVNARELGICRVAKIESQMDRTEKNEVLEGFARLSYQFIWIAPERFQMKDFRRRLGEIRNATKCYGYAVIDEAHCLSEWGHDFRVSYLKLHDTIQKYCSPVVMLALTATASRNVLEDLICELQITKQDVQTSASLDRPELSYHVVRIGEGEREEALGCLFDEIDETFREREHIDTIFEPHGDAGKDSICGIVFSNTKSNSKRPYASCSGVVSLMARRGVKADEYHADRGDLRTQIQQAFIDNEFTVMAATKAFGMGVNKKNVRYTIHNGLPWSIEAFYQEAGRAGRDKKHNKSECYILYSDDSPPEVVDKVFAEGTSIEEIRDSVRSLEGDLGTLFFLWSSSHEDTDIETQAILGVCQELLHRRRPNGKAVVPDDLVRMLVIDKVIDKWNQKKKENPGSKAELHMKTQDALYKLTLLGVVRDWTVDYRTNTYEVAVEDPDKLTDEYEKDKLETYIRRHDPQFSFESKRHGDKRYIEIYERAPQGNKLEALVKVLLLWTDANIVYQRRRAINNMLDLCRLRPDKDDFRTYINNFFRLDTQSNDQLDAIVRTTDDLDIWVRLFTRLDDDPQVTEERIKDIDELKAISALCDRYRESYHDNIGLTWATMMARLLSDGFSRDETTELFGLIADGAKGYEGLDADDLFVRTLSLMEYAGPEAQSAFGAAVVSHVPYRAMDVYDRLGDTSTMEYLVVIATERLRKIWGRTGHK